MEALAVTPNVPVAADAAGQLAVQSRAITTLRELETALDQGLREEWERVVARDPLAQLFQSHGWCMPWYRAFAASFDPYVIVVSANDRVVGLLPMAVERATRSLVFASDNMADYRDIVALPGYRRQVAEALIDHYLAQPYTNPLQVGWLDPASDTPALFEAVCRARKLRHSFRSQPCWRWVPPKPAKPSAQKFLNWYKRNGTVSFEVIESEAAWQEFREEYFRQHSLRQIQAGRPMAFGDARRAAIYEDLFHSKEIQPHVTGFFHNGRMLAGHFGYVWRGVLLLGPPTIRLEDEQRSPAVILLSWIIQSSDALGLKGFDMTIGESDFKKRLGNQRVEIGLVEIHRTAWRYHLRAAAARGVALVKHAVDRAAGPDTWKTRVKPAFSSVAVDAAHYRELGVAGTLREGLTRIARWVYDPRVRRTYVLARETVAAVAPDSSHGGQINQNRIEDLLLWKGTSPAVSAAMTACARPYARLRAAGHTLHTLVIDGSLAAWCYSSTAEIHDAFVMPEFRATRAAETLLAGVAHALLQSTAADVRLTVSPRDRIVDRAAARVGRLVEQSRSPQVFGSPHLVDAVSRVWRRLTWRAVRNRAQRLLRYEAEERVYRLSPAAAAELPASTDFARDRWEDLELFVPSEPRHTREACLADWRQRRARGEHVYTRVEDGRLAAYGWVVDRQRTIALTWVGQSIELPEGSAVIYDYYTLPEYRHRDFYQRLLMHALQDTAQTAGTNWIYLSILASDTVPRWWVERFEMEHCGSYFYSRILWRRKKWQSISTAARSNG